MRETASDLFATGRMPDSPIHAFWIPGRIEVLGKHTDYAGGSSLLAASQQGFVLAAAPRNDRLVSVHALDLNKRTTFAIDPDLTPQIGDWSNYPHNRCAPSGAELSRADRRRRHRLCQQHPHRLGHEQFQRADDRYLHGPVSNQRAGATDRYRHNIGSSEQLAEYLGTIENGQTYGSLVGDRGVGTFGGSEDHTAILCCRSGHLSRYRYCPTQFEARPAMPAGYTFAIASSGVIADKTGSAREKYNRASALAAEVTATWNEATGHDDAHMAAMVQRCGSDPEPILGVLASAQGRRFPSEDLVRRFRHFYIENEEIVPAAAAALANGDMAGFAQAANRSQGEGVRLLGNQIAETEALAELALQSGALAASAFGAGFGGSVWALVREDSVERVLGEWSSTYSERFPEHRGQRASFKPIPDPQQWHCR